MKVPSDLPQRRKRARNPARNRILLVIAGIALFVLITSLRGIASFYTDYLWFDSLDQTGVWSGVLGAKIALAVIFTGTFFVLLFVNLLIADRIAPAFRPSGPEEEMVERYRELVGKRTGLVRVGVSLLFALIAGAGVSSRWNDWLLFTNRVDFGQKDPLFKRDIGFYVFQLPFLNFIIGWLFAALVIVLIVTAVAHYLNGGIRVQTPFQRVTPQVKAHISVLLALLALTKTAGYFLQQFSLTTSSRGTVDGATYTDVRVQLPAIRLLALISIFAFVLFIVNIFRRGWVLPVLAVGLWAFVAVVAGGILPTLIQRFRVEPSESSRERTYIVRNIEATREALALDVEPEPFDADQRVDEADISVNLHTLLNVRLWDPAPTILGQTYQQLQQLRPFYKIADVDVDRYMIDGQLQQVDIAARELNTPGVPQGSWEARHLAFTHGYGLVMSPANAKTRDGRPSLLVRDVPVEDDVNLDIENPAVYFGEELGGYVVVNTKRREIDFQDDQGETQFRSYDGDDGIRMGSLLRKAAFALRFGDFNPLVSGNLTGDSRILIRRDVRERLEALAPFLAFDNDPYPAVVNGRIVWIVDAYTTSDRFPYGQRADTDGIHDDSGLDSRFNYVRNSVKAVVDAYDGTAAFYIIDETDPIARAYRKAFPNLFRAGEPSDELRNHFRYPEDLFRVQTNMWGRYHLSDPDDFYNNNGAWIVARDPGTSRVVASSTSTTSGGGGTATGPVSTNTNRFDPYYQLMQLPGEQEDSFLILRPFAPFTRDDTRQQLSAFMIARSDPGQYGRLQTFVVSRSDVDGPGLVQGTMSSDPDVAQLETLLGIEGGGSDILFGNILLVPIEQSLLYVRPVYVQAESNKLPLLRKVIVEFEGEVGLGDTLADALADLPSSRFARLPDDLIAQLNEVQSKDASADEETPDGEQPPPPPAGPESVQQLLAEAEQLFAEGDAALQQSPPDFATYQARYREARARIAEADALLGEDDSEPTADTTSTTVGA